MVDALVSDGQGVAMEWSFRSSGNAGTLSVGCVFVGVWARLPRLSLHSCMSVFVMTQTSGTKVIVSLSLSLHQERARRAPVRARWDAQGGNGAARRESARARTVVPTRRTTATEPSILPLLHGRLLSSVPR